MRDVREQEVVTILEHGHVGPLSEIKGTIARVRGHGPFKRLDLPGPQIGRLKFQAPTADRQCSLSSFFADDARRFEDWLDALDVEGRSRHQFQIEKFATEGKFDLPPVYDFEGQVLDGGHRTRAAYYAHLRSDKIRLVTLEIVCDVRAIALPGLSVSDS